MKHVVHIELVKNRQGSMSLELKSFSEDQGKKSDVSLERLIGVLEMAKLQAYTGSILGKKKPAKRLSAALKGNA